MVEGLNDKQLRRIARNPSFIADYNHLVSSNSPAGQDPNAWEFEMINSLKKDASRFKRRPISELRIQEAAKVSGQLKIIDVFNKLSVSQKRQVLENAGETHTQFLQAVKNINSLMGIAKSFEDGTSCLIANDKVKHLNSLQVRQSERYVFSAKNDFEVVREMIGMNEKYKYGPSAKVE